MANNPLAADHEGRRENWLLLLQVQWPPPLMAAEAGREADANSRAASPRGCTRLRRKPLAGEPRGSASLLHDARVHNLKSKEVVSNEHEHKKRKSGDELGSKSLLFVNASIEWM